MFEQATKEKYRFDSVQGKLTVEDLWDLPLISSTGNIASLDDIAINLDEEVAQHKKSFVVKPSSRISLAKKKLDIVKYIIKVKMQEQEEREKEAQRAEEKQRIMEIIDEKQNEKLKSKSLSELKKMIKNL